MKNLDHDPSVLTERPPISLIQLTCLSQFEVPNCENVAQSNPTSTGHVVIDIVPLLVNGLATDEEDTLSSPIVNGHPAKFHYYKKILKLIFTVALFAMFPSLTQVAQLKFTKKSPFESHAFFSNMGVVSYVIAVPTSVIFFAMANYLEGFARDCSSRIYYIYMILRCVFCFLVILAPLSFVFVLLIPNDGYNWIGYLVISLLFVVILAYNIIDYLKLRCKKMYLT